jgi:hypothetical protein
LRRRGALKALAGVAVAGTVARTVSRDAKAFCSEEGEACDMMCCEGLACDGDVCVAIGSPDCPTLNQSNQCSNVPTNCEGNGCTKKKHDKKHEKKLDKKRKKGKRRR